jgi:OOP family OmpA-OmpF porin
MCSHRWPVRLLLAVAIVVAGGRARAEAPRQARNLIEGGLYGGIFIPNADHDWYGDLHPVKRPLASAAFDVGLRAAFLPIAYAGVELELGVIPTKTRDDGSATLWVGRGHLIGQLPLGRITPFVLAGAGGWRLSSDPSVLGSDTDALFHWGAGVKVALGERILVRADFRHDVQSGVAGDGALTSHFELLAGASYVFGHARRPVVIADTDGDGVPDTADQCPTVKGPPPTGCPPKDTDGDGIADADDKCPTVPGVPPDGCPRDTDGDGIPDDKDKCPKVKGPAPDGCPPPGDADGDGVPDTEDKCPTVAGVPPDGCPPDTDGDGITDDQDKCPTVKGPAPDGCPPALRRFAGVVAGIAFDRGSEKLHPRSHAVLNQAAKVLREYKELKLIIRGHVEQQASRDAAMDLSLRRAEAVKDYLVKRGVAADRLRTAGVGSDEPIAGADSNRIEFMADLFH